MERIMTLKSLLDPDFTQLSASRIRNLEKTDSMQQLRRNLQENVPDHQWSLIRKELLNQIVQLLEIPLHPILVKSWHTHEAVQREVQQQRTNRDNHEASIVVLDAHEIRSTHSPTLSTKVGQSHSIDFRFFIGVAFELRNISLKIQQGEIKAILAGVMSGSGFMQYQNATLIENDFQAIKLTGEIHYTPNHNKRADMISPMTQTEINVEDNNEEKDQPVTNITDITTENREQKEVLSPFKRNVIQFMLGILLAFIAMFVFWHFVNGQ